MIRQDIVDNFINKGLSVEDSEKLADNFINNLTTDQIQFMLDNEMFIDDDGIEKHLKVILLQGSVRSGKTWISQMKFVLNVMKGDPSNLNIICGVSASTIEQNILQLMQNLFGQGVVSYRINKMQAIIKDPQGREHIVLLRSFYNAQAIKQIQGLTIDKALVDEAEHAQEEWYNMLYSRCCLTTSCIYMTLNPSTPGHWINKNILKNLDKLPMIKSYLFLLMNNNHISEDYKKQICRMYRPGQAVYKQLILGEWTQMEGLCFPGLLEDEDRFYRQFNQIPKDKIDHLNVGIDWGGNKSCTVIVLTAVLKYLDGFFFVDCVKLPKEKLGPEYILNTIYETIRDWMEEYRQYRLYYCYADCADQIMISGLRQTFVKHQLRLQVVDSYKPKLLNKINMLNVVINLGLWGVSPGCPLVFDAWKQIVFDKDGVNVKDTNLNNENDIWDAQFYSIGDKAYWNRLNYNLLKK